jgi:hypothetical protein
VAARLIPTVTYSLNRLGSAQRFEPGKFLLQTHRRKRPLPVDG